MLNFNNSNPMLTNVIMWSNSAATGPEIHNTFLSTPNISYSDIQGCGGSSSWNPACGNNGGSNIDADPLFVDADGADNIFGTADDNLRLQSGSPAIDAGNNAAIPAGVITDLDGNPRIISGTVDMGAYEAQKPKIYLPLVLKMP
jgi:hypothetical protein